MEINIIEDGTLYHIYFKNKKIGDFDLDIDGHYKFWPNPSNLDPFDSYYLKMILKELDNLNKQWDEKINSYF